MQFTDVLQRIAQSYNGTAILINAYGDNPGAGLAGGVNIGYPPSTQPMPIRVFAPISGVNLANSYYENGMSCKSILDNAGNVHKFYLSRLNGYYHNIMEGDEIGMIEPIFQGNGQATRPVLHYEIEDSLGRKINPQTWWDQGYDQFKHIANADGPLPSDGIIGNSFLPHFAAGYQDAVGKNGPSIDFAKKMLAAANNAPHPTEKLYSALVLDLNGNLLEVADSNKLAMFDAQGNGTRTAQHILKASDAYLALDRNGNGMIDNGSELFSNGQLNTLGNYANLQELDSNQDGQINAEDSNFAELRVWHDWNQDGTSTFNEVSSLAQYRVHNIRTQLEVNNNVIDPLSRDFLGQSTTVLEQSNGMNIMAGQFSLMPQHNLSFIGNFFRQQERSIHYVQALPREVTQLPNLHGSGWVKDMWDAATNDMSLRQLLNVDSAPPPPTAGVMGYFDDVLGRWADSSSTGSLQQQAQQQGITLQYALDNDYPPPEFLEKLGIVERFMGFTFSGENGEVSLKPLAPSATPNQTMLVHLNTHIVEQVNAAYEQLRTDVYQSLLPKSNTLHDLKDIFETGLHAGDPNFVNMEAQFLQYWQFRSDGQQKVLQFLESYGPKRLQDLGWDVFGFINKLISTDPTALSRLSHFSVWNLAFSQGGDNVPRYDNEQALIQVASNGTTYLPSNGGDDLQFGSENDDRLDSGFGDDHVYGNAGNDFLNTSEGSDFINAGSGNDTVDSGIGNDTIVGGAGDDFIYGFAGKKIYVFAPGDGRDRITLPSDPESSNVIRFTNGITADKVILVRTIDNALRIVMPESNDEILLNYMDFIDTKLSLHFSNGEVWDNFQVSQNIKVTDRGDYIYGTPGNDYLVGFGGDDTIDGADGDDTLDGGTGIDSLKGGWGNNTYLFGHGDGLDIIFATPFNYSGMAQNTLQFKAGIAASDLRLVRIGNDLLIQIDSSNQLNTGSLHVERFFDNDDLYNPQNPLQKILFADGSSWDLPTIAKHALQGNDDYQSLRGTIGNDFIQGKGGNDELIALAGDDTLDGGTGADNINAGGGNNTILFGLGDGQDTVQCDWFSPQNSNNTLQFKEGINATDLQFINKGMDLLIKLKNSWGNDSVLIERFFVSDQDPSAQLHLRQISFADGTELNLEAIRSLSYSGTEGDEYIHGSARNDLIVGLGGNDRLFGFDGDDTMVGGVGTDEINAGRGNNTYVFARGDGHDRIFNNEQNANAVNTLQFKAGIREQDLILTRHNDTLQIIVESELVSEGLTIERFFENDDVNNALNPLQKIVFDNGTIWDINTIAQNAFRGVPANELMRGTVGNDHMHGQAGDDVMQGMGGNDTLEGGANNDTLIGDTGDDLLTGGTGNDTLDGGLGNNTYQFARGDGGDQIAAMQNGAPDRVNTLQFKTGILASDLTLQRFDDNLSIGIQGSNDLVWVKQFYTANDLSNSANPLQKISFADGTNWSLTQISNQAFKGTAGNDFQNGTLIDDVMTGQAGNDEMFGNDGNDNLSGDAGHDKISGGAGNDSLQGGEGVDALYGGAGNDVLNGGRGNNSYLFGKGDGKDVIVSSIETFGGRFNALIFHANVLPSEVQLQRVGDALNATLSTGDSISIQSYFRFDNPNVLANPIQAMRFSDGTVWDAAAIKARTFAGTSGVDSYYGTIQADVMQGLAGNDLLNGRGADDVLMGGDGNDQLYGEGGNDTLEGGAGHDTLEGGGGIDLMNGGLGNNTYLFGVNFGQDTIVSVSDTTVGRFNTLQLRGVNSNAITLTQNGSALKVAINNTQDNVTVQNFFLQNNPSNTENPLQQIKFADGSIWKLNDIVAKLSTPLVANGINDFAAQDGVQLVGNASFSGL